MMFDAEPKVSFETEHLLAHILTPMDSTGS